MITLFLIPGSERDNVDRARESFGSLAVRVFESDRNIDCSRVLTPFYAYLYKDEFLSKGLQAALPIYLMNPDWNALLLLRKRGSRIFQSARVFRGLVPLDGNLNPKKQVRKQIFYKRVLDGFIYGE